MNNIELASPSSVLFNYVEELKESINQVTSDSFNNIETHEIDCGLMPSFEQGFLASKHTETFILELKKNNKPAVYWFEVSSEHSAKDIYDPYPDLKKGSERNLPAFKKGFKSWQSKVLYVGKVKNNLSGRMFVHLGYHPKKTIQGLQLCHWTHQAGLKLKIHIIYLPENLEMLAGVLEFQLSRFLNPILGKHK